MFCPVELARDLLASPYKTWPATRDDPEAWLVRTTEGEHATKATVVSSWAMAAGTAIQGHSARRSGALYYTRAGAPVPEITYLGRWHSDLVFEYAEEAWASRPCNMELQGEEIFDFAVKADSGTLRTTSNGSRHRGPGND